MGTREPRPALQRADDGSVHPASPRVVTHKTAGQQASTRSKGTRPLEIAESPASEPTSTVKAVPAPLPNYKGKPVDLEVEVPKKLRKAVRAKADAQGKTVDEFVVDALTSYLVADD